jgi:hypothetical protein
MIDIELDRAEWEEAMAPYLEIEDREPLPRPKLKPKAKDQKPANNNG